MITNNAIDHSTGIAANPADNDQGHNHDDDHWAPEMTAAKEVIIHQDLLAILNSYPTNYLGSWHYRPHSTLPNLQDSINSTLTVLIPLSLVSWSNPAVRKAAIWGSTVYSDDSDVVAMLIHSGQITLPNPISGAGRSKAEGKDQRMSMEVDSEPSSELGNGHLAVTLRVYPRLAHYPSTFSNGIRSRCWESHDGVSLKVEAVALDPTHPLAHACRKSRKQLIRDRATLREWATSNLTCGHPFDHSSISFLDGQPCIFFTQQLEPVLYAKSFGAQCGSIRYLFICLATEPDPIYQIRRTVSTGNGQFGDELVLDQIHWSTDITLRSDGIQAHGLGPATLSSSPNSLGESGRESTSGMGDLTRKTVFVRASRVWFIERA